VAHLCDHKTAETDDDDEPGECRGKDEGHHERAEPGKDGSAERGEKREWDKQERAEDERALCESAPSASCHLAARYQVAGSGEVAGTWIVATQVDAGARMRTVAVVVPVAVLCEMPQLTVSVTRIPTGTDTVTVRTAPSRATIVVRPPSKVPLCDGTISGWPVGAVVVVVVVLVEVVDVVVALGTRCEGAV